MRKTSETKEIFIFLALHCLFEFYAGITGATFILFLYDQNLNTMETNLIVATSLIVTFLMEIPTGAVSDVLDYKITTVISGILLCMTNLFFLFGDGMTVCLIAQIFLGVACALESGTLDAWIISNTSKETAEYIFIRKNKYISIMMITAGLAGGMIADYKMKGIFAAGLLAAFLYTCIAAVWMKNVPEKRTSHIGSVADGMKKTITVSIRYCIYDKEIRNIILFNSMLAFGFSPVFVFWSPVLHSYDQVNYTLIGCAWILMRLLMLAGNLVVDHIGSDKDGRLVFVTVLCGGSILFLSFQTLFFTIFAGILVFEFLLGVIYPLRETVLNVRIKNENRATILSFNSMMVCIFHYCSMLIMGKIAEVYSIRTTWLISGIMLCGTAVWIMWKKYRK